MIPLIAFLFNHITSSFPRQSAFLIFFRFCFSLFFLEIRMFLRSFSFLKASVLLKEFIEIFNFSSDMFTNVSFAIRFSAVTPKKLLLATATCGEYFNKVRALKVYGVRFLPKAKRAINAISYRRNTVHQINTCKADFSESLFLFLS